MSPASPLQLLWEFYTVLVLVRVVLSWTGVPDSAKGVAEFVQRATEPALRPFRRLLPPARTGGLDLSPVLLLVAGGLAVQFLNALIYGR